MFVVKPVASVDCVYLTPSASVQILLFISFSLCFFLHEAKDGTQKVEEKTPSQEEDDRKPGHAVHLPLL